MTQKIILGLTVLAILAFAPFLIYNKIRPLPLPSATDKLSFREKPLDKYTIEALSQKIFGQSPITVGDTIKDNPSFTSKYFFVTVEGKKVSGLVNIPKKPGTYPVIIMFRGYVDRESYSTGTGTQRAGEVFAQNGFITVAPDFLGYGQSDNPSENVMEERFQTYTTALTLLKSIDNLNKALNNSGIQVNVDTTKVGIWGHSNGGQIALTALEVSGQPYPTVLWAPVSKPFPYSILYYTDDFDDHGKLLRKAIADFEKDYDAEKYSLTNYLDRIQAPIEIHQGGEDDAVPQKWSDELVKKLEDLNKEVTYYTYPGDDHNFAQGNWSTVVQQNITFFKKKLKV